MTGKLFVLDLSGGRVLRMNSDGSDCTAIVSGRTRWPDGIAVDVAAGHVYWTNMGVAAANDGSIERADLDGRNVVTIVPNGGTHTPKQLVLEGTSRKLYWADREGMRVMRANLDGSNIETLVETARGGMARADARNWCVGIAVDPRRGKLYWTQKGGENAGQGRILRANLELARGESPAGRGDVEVLFDGLPEPIDLDLDLDRGVLYWSDRGDAPRGNSINRATIDVAPRGRTAPEILDAHLMEGIGLSLDPKNQRMFFTDLGGCVYSANLDGSNRKTLAVALGNLTGIQYVELGTAR